MNDARRLLSPAGQPERADPLDVSVCGGLLVERRERADRIEFVLFGELDREAARAVELTLLEGAPSTVLLDLTYLSGAESAAMCRLVDRQRADYRAGRQLLLRIAPSQVSQLTAAEPGDSEQR